MRLGIFSDVHANFEALQAVEQAYTKESVDQLICLGDTVGYGADPQLCADRVQEIAAATVLGNHDAAVAGRMDYSYYYDAARETLSAHVDALNERAMNWLRSLPYEHRQEGLSFCHGSPDNLEEFDYVFSIEQANALHRIYDTLARVTFIGHSHLCKAFALAVDDVHEVVGTDFQIRDGFKYIISVGSVGQPRDYDSRASYTIFDTETSRFEFKRIAYDIEIAAKKILAQKLEPTFGNRLFLGV